MVHSAECWAEEENLRRDGYICPATRAGGGGWKAGLGPLCRAGGAQHPPGIFTSWWSLICLCHWWGEAKTTPSQIALLLEVVSTKPPVVGPAWLKELQLFSSSLEVCAFHSGIHQLFFCLKRRLSSFFPSCRKLVSLQRNCFWGIFGPCRKMRVA